MSFDQFPTEILLDIGDHVTNTSLRELCLASRRLMSIFQEKAYYAAELDDTLQSANRLLALASGPRGKFVRRVQYSPRDPWRKSARENIRLKQGNPGPVRYPLLNPYVQLTSETRQALQSLSLFPSLEKFQFDLGGWNLNEWRDAPCCFTLFGFIRNNDSYHEEPWRIVVENSLQAVAKNTTGTFSQLEINGLPPTGSEYYYACASENWRSLLSSLKTFEISLAEVNGRFGTMTNAHNGFLYYFPYAFFQHLTNVQDLRIAGTEDAIIGSAHTLEPIDWTSFHMPHLRSFKIEYSHIMDGIIGFFSNHAATLERVCLKNCFGTRKQDWLSLIQTVLDKQPTKLIEFEIAAYPVRLRSGQSDYFSKGDICGYDMSEETKREKMRRFVVGQANDTCGHFEPVEGNAIDGDPELDETDVVERWKELEELMARNRRTIGSNGR
ncbi:hypothetical protein ACLX1H_009258 [Fusarium chlamydosporum]